ncbi:MULTISPECIES: hypothetical protein [Burkholderia]|uniref:hypothetical protein n=1 Tax=Burkholderia TaxID=32008 RepID=UPI0012E9A2B9|nr:MULTISPECIES: hypothetical protein [unclassified Burkholderia]
MEKMLDRANGLGRALPAKSGRALHNLSDKPSRQPGRRRTNLQKIPAERRKSRQIAEFAGISRQNAASNRAPDRKGLSNRLTVFYRAVCAMWRIGPALVL